MTLTDRQKKLAAAGVGGLLFLIFMLSRARNAANTAATPADSVVPTAVPGGAGQADFGGDQSGALGGMSNDITGALGTVQSSLDTVGSNQGTLYDQGTDIASQVGALTTNQASVQTSIDGLAAGLSSLSDRIPATDGTPGPAATPSRAASPAKQSGKATVKPKTVVKGGQVYHYYDTDPKKKGYERKVHVRAASTPKRSPSQHPHAAPVRAKPKTTKRKSRR